MPADSLAQSLIANAGRLKILTALAAEQKLDFVALRNRAHLTDGNLASHAKRLRSAGLVEIEKHFRAGKPVTTMLITREGRSALRSHVENVMSSLQPTRLVESSPTEVGVEDEWVD